MNASMLPATLPATPDAQLPQRYEAARNAIAECERVDECKNWSDRAAALASYARQAKDDSLRVMAVRIQARAERRCGELLKQIAPTPGARTDLGRVRTLGDGMPSGIVLPVSRTQAATDAGLSEHQRKTALRIATIPDADFDAQVESPQPPTVTQLANLGRMTRVLAPDPMAERFKAACTVLLEFANFCDANDAIETAHTFGADDMEMARRCVATLDQWLDRFVTALGASV